jgi:hypothetical protein
MPDNGGGGSQGGSAGNDIIPRDYARLLINDWDETDNLAEKYWRNGGSLPYSMADFRLEKYRHYGFASAIVAARRAASPDEAGVLVDWHRLLIAWQRRFGGDVLGSYKGVPMPDPGQNEVLPTIRESADRALFGPAVALAIVGLLWRMRSKR